MTGTIDAVDAASERPIEELKNTKSKQNNAAQKRPVGNSSILGPLRPFHKWFVKKFPRLERGATEANFIAVYNVRVHEAVMIPTVGSADPRDFEQVLRLWDRAKDVVKSAEVTLDGVLVERKKRKGVDPVQFQEESLTEMRRQLDIFHTSPLTNKIIDIVEQKATRSVSRLLAASAKHVDNENVIVTENERGIIENLLRRYNMSVKRYAGLLERKLTLKKEVEEVFQFGEVTTVYQRLQRCFVEDFHDKWGSLKSFEDLWEEFVLLELQTRDLTKLLQKLPQRKIVYSCEHLKVPKYKTLRKDIRFIKAMPWNGLHRTTKTLIVDKEESAAQLARFTHSPAHLEADPVKSIKAPEPSAPASEKAESEAESVKNEVQETVPVQKELTEVKKEEKVVVEFEKPKENQENIEILVEETRKIEESPPPMPPRRRRGGIKLMRCKDPALNRLPILRNKFEKNSDYYMKVSEVGNLFDSQVGALKEAMNEKFQSDLSVLKERIDEIIVSIDETDEKNQALIEKLQNLFTINEEIEEEREEIKENVEEDAKKEADEEIEQQPGVISRGLSYIGSKFFSSKQTETREKDDSEENAVVNTPKEQQIIGFGASRNKDEVQSEVDTKLFIKGPARNILKTPIQKIAKENVEVEVRPFAMPEFTQHLANGIASLKVVKKEKDEEKNIVAQHLVNGRESLPSVKGGEKSVTLDDEDEKKTVPVFYGPVPREKEEENKADTATLDI